MSQTKFMCFRWLVDRLHPKHLLPFVKEVEGSIGVVLFCEIRYGTSDTLVILSSYYRTVNEEIRVSVGQE